MRFLTAGLAAALLAGCHVVEAKAWNLSELHDESGHHRYSGALEGDTEYFLRNVVLRSITPAGTSFEAKAPVAIPDPASACLENLIALEGFRTDLPRNLGIQVEWCARLAVADPSKLVRERAVLALGHVGAILSAGSPESLPKETTPAGPNEISEALAGLLRAARPALERGSRVSATERLDLESACQVVKDLALDLDGARRMLHASVDLASSVGFFEREGAPLADLAAELEKRCIRFALAAALRDVEPLVRGAGVEASVRCVGPEVFDPILAQLGREPSPEVLVRVMDLVREYGLPKDPPRGSTATAEQATRSRLAAIYDLLDRPESSVRVGAMRALARVSGADVRSLREEDWQSWWIARRETQSP